MTTLEADTTPATEAEKPRSPLRHWWLLMVALLVAAGLSRWALSNAYEQRLIAKLRGQGATISGWMPRVWPDSAHVSWIQIPYGTAIPWNVNCESSKVTPSKLPVVFQCVRALHELRGLHVDGYDLRSLIQDPDFNLRSLQCRNCQLDDESLRAIAQWKSLTSLTLSDCQITPAQVQLLKGSATINTLNLSHNPLNDECLDALASLPLLRNLDLTATGISDRAVIEFQAKHPGVQVTDD